MNTDPERSGALLLACDICPDCACAAPMPDGSPCPYFRADNFYYDPLRKRFCCYSWAEKQRLTAESKKPSAT